MIIVENQRDVHIVRFQKKLDMFICSDVHWDSKKCDRDLFKKHLKKAEENEALVFINGDFFDLMQGRYDPRSGKYDIRPEYKHANYIDQVINDGAEVLSKYKVKYIIGQGNHETGILKRLETNPSERLVERIKYNGGEAYLGGYSGWIILENQSSEVRGSKTTTRLKYHHGAGGGKRSKGILSADIDRAENPDADILCKGHDHNKWHLPTSVRRINRTHDIINEDIHILRTGSYKKRSDNFSGWDIERDFNNPRLGGWFITIRKYKKDGIKRNKVSVVEAD